VPHRALVEVDRWDSIGRQAGGGWVAADQTPRIGSDFSTSGRSQPSLLASRHFRRVNFNNSTPTSHLRTAMTRTIFPAAFNYPRTRTPTSERVNAVSRNIDRLAFSLSLSLSLSLLRDDHRVRPDTGSGRSKTLRVVVMRRCVIVVRNYDCYIRRGRPEKMFEPSVS